MSDFKQAIEWMKEGKKVRRSYWGNKELYGFIQPENSFIHFKDKESLCSSCFLNDTLNLEADDWEIYCEEHDWDDDYTENNMNGVDHRSVCRNCGIEKPKESLSDSIIIAPNKISQILPLFKVKEKIQNVQRRLKEGEWRVSNYDVGKIFKEEFGEDLL